MAEDAVDFYEINYDELKSKIRQIESVFDVKVTVSGPTQEVNEECDVSSAKGEIKSSVRIFSSSGNKKLVAEAKEYILSEACQDAAQCRACREGRRRCSGQTDREHKHGDSVTENSEENVRDQSCACVLEYVNRKRSQLNQELSQIIGSKPPMEAGDDGRDALAQCAAAGEEREGDHGDDASTSAAEGGRCEGEEEGEPSPSAGSHLVIPILSPGVDSNHDSCYDSDVSSNGGSRRNSQQHLDTEHSDVSRTASDTLAAEHTPDGFNDKSDLVQDLNNATKTTESVIDDGGKSPDSEEIVLSSGKTDDKLPSEEAESSESAKDGNLMGIPDYAIKVEFGLKLGYSEDQVRAVLAQTGCEVNQNELLSQLIKVGKVGSTSEQDSGDESDVDEEDFCPDSRGGEKRCSNVVTENAVKTPLVPASHTVDESPKPKDASHGTRVEPLDSSSNLRPIVIDGSNVAMSHGNKEVFSCRGIKLAVDWFRLRRHTDIVVFVPQWRKETPRVDTPITDQDILVELEQEKILVFTPARRVGGKRIVCYDDRYIIQLAVENGGIIVSNDNYRDLQSESEEYKRVIEKRLLMYSFVNDRFMPPEDPLGKYGPRLDNFLQKEPTVPDPVPPICPYGKKCTYGNKCKYYHPERGPGHIKSVTEKLAESGGKKIQQVQKHGFYADGKKNQALNKKAPLSKAKSLSPASKQPLSRTKSLQPEMRLGGLSPGPLSTLPGNLTAPNRDDLADKKLQDSPVRVSVTYDAEDSAKYNARLAKLAQRMEDDEKARGLSGRKSKQGHMGSHESLKPPNHWSLVHESLRPVQSDPPSLHYDTSGLGSGHLSLAKKLSDEGSDVGRRSSPRSPAQTEQQLQRDLEQARINAEREQLEHRLQQLVQREKRIEHEQFHDHHHAMYNRPHAQVTGTKSAGMEGMNMHKPLARQLSLQGSEDPRIHAGPPPNYAQQPSIPGVRFHGNPAPKSIIIGERGPPPQWTEQYMESPGPRFSHRPPLTRVGSVTDMGRRPMHNPVQRIPSAPVTQHSQVTSSAPSMTRQNSTSDPQLNLVSEDFVGALQGAAQYPGGPADSRSIWAQKFNQMHPHLTHQNLSPSASGPTPGVKVAFGGPGVRPMAQYDQFHPSLGHTCSNPLDAHMSTPPPSLHGSSQNLMQGYPGASQSPHSFAHHSSNPSLSSVSQNFSPYSQEMQAMLLSQYGSGLGHSKAAPTHFFPPSPFDAIQTSIASNNLFSPQQISAEPHAHMSSPDPHSRPSSSQSMDSLSSSLQMSNRPVQYHGGLPLGGQSSASPGGGGGSGGIDPCQEPPLLLADPKHQHIFAHLCALFPKDDVQKVVYQFPHETNPKELCQHIMRRINNK